MATLLTPIFSTAYLATSPITSAGLAGVLKTQGPLLFIACETAVVLSSGIFSSFATGAMARPSELDVRLWTVYPGRQVGERRSCVCNHDSPDGIALWKQMKALGYAPKVASCEKCAHTIAWPRVLGELAQGTLMFGWWSPDSKCRGTDHVMAVWSKKYGMTTDLETAASNFGFTQVLLDAIKRSGTADPK